VFSESLSELNSDSMSAVCHL